MYTSMFIMVTIFTPLTSPRKFHYLLKCRHFFYISNGVRQGGILSPSLFAVYMDDLSSLLNASRIG